ncbi:ustilagic acid biosynthesis regulator rua1 [Gigaspora margarita]|uniref:Ustilagic acid biosynthesis regulator rua1 n=1 Tax=Gigaspora margarita TaxID=4874 RepID=A0A8H4B0Z7_GIGMA|nr:ustilagic acid biosynthesis regulator rua1 [Gigaspora margarita]
MLFEHEDDQNHLANKKNIENLDFPSHVSCQQSDEEKIPNLYCTNHENSAVIQNFSCNRPGETNHQEEGETQDQLHYILNDDQSKSQNSYAVDNQHTIQNTIHDHEEGLQSICNNINDCSNEIHEQRSSPLGIKQTSNPYSSVPSFMEPSRHHFQSMMCCNDPCCKEACEYTNSASIGTEIMQFSWNVDDPQFSGSLMPFSSSSDENVTVPVYRWNGHIVSLPTHSLQLPTSLNQISSPNLFIQTQSNKRTMQEELFSDLSLNEFNKPYALPTISNVHQQTSSFCKRNSPVTLLSLESTVEYEQDTFKQFHAKYETYKFQPRIDLNEIVPEMPEPPADLNDPRPDAQPRRQKLKYPGDMYTPQWVRYSGHSKEGFCNDCKPGKWLQLKNSAYWYHKQFFHGISSVSGKMFVPPVETRKFDSGDCTEGLCHQCGQWVPIATSKKKNSMLWFRHAHKCHVYVKPKGYPPGGKRR